MKNILITISYDGTDFCGWQRQDTGSSLCKMRTVQEEIEKALEKMHKQHITLYGSGRTDSGVHALGQAANFFSPIDSIPAKNYIRALNSMLSPDIRIIDSREVSKDFNARYSATSRVYKYFINASETVNAAMNRFSWTINHKPDLERLNRLSNCLRGEIDCASFAASGDMSLSTFRYLENAHFYAETSFFDKNELIVFEIEANAFLWKMVRTLTGTLLHLDRIKADDNALQEIINKHNRGAAFETAPASGLFLYSIKFDGIRRHV